MRQGNRNPNVGFRDMDHCLQQATCTMYSQTSLIRGSRGYWILKEKNAYKRGPRIREGRPLEVQKLGKTIQGDPDNDIMQMDDFYASWHDVKEFR